jgi:hypothetical protein
MIGSTANIVALGMLEKHGGSQISFFQWFRIGFLCTLLSGAIAIGALLALAPFMPDHKITFNKLSAESGYVPASKNFSGELAGTLTNEDGVHWLTGKNGGRIRVILPANTTAEGRVKISGVFSKDSVNKAYPYMLEAKKITPLERD